MSHHGEAFQTALDRIERRVAARPVGPLLLGVALGAASLVAGLLVFLAVFVVLVGVVR